MRGRRRVNENPGTGASNKTQRHQMRPREGEGMKNTMKGGVSPTIKIKKRENAA